MTSGPEPGPDSPIPDKLYFKIGEVAQLVGVQPHVLRYWEREVSAVRPGKTASRQRRYRRRDVEIFRQIRKLLHEERYTLAGARRRILSRGDDPDDSAASRDNEPAAATNPAPQTNPGVSAAPLNASRDLDQESPSTPLDGGAPSESLPAPRSTVATARLRAGLEDIIRLVGEEP